MTTLKTWSLGVLVSVSCSMASATWDMPQCAVEIASYYRVPLDLLGGIRHAEGGELGQRVGPNSNGSYDLGPMQINTNWFNGTFDINLQDYDIYEEDVLNNECTNIAVGAWVLNWNYASLGNWYEAVAAYNAGLRNRHIGYGYADRVFRWRNKIKNLWVPHREPLVIQAEGY